MLNFGNKEFRNLQEQVLKNANDVEEIKQSLGTALPNPIPGPQGPAGESITGPRGERGAIWTVGTDFPASPTIYDMHLKGTDVYQYNGTKWVLYRSIQGAQGLPGAKGETGERGPQGEQGPQGIQGPVGPVVKIIGIYSDITKAPSPASLYVNQRNSGALIGASDPYTLYIITGETIQQAAWTSVGTFNNHINVDNQLSTTSTNPVENKVITETINELQAQVNNNEQDIGAINSAIVKDYTNPNGDMTINKGLTVSTNGDTTIGRKLIVQGNATVSGVTIAGDTTANYIITEKSNIDITPNGKGVLRISDRYAMLYGDDNRGGEEFTISMKDNPSGVGKVINHITGGASYVPTSKLDLTPKKYVDGEIGKLQTATGSDWEFLGKVAEKTFSKAFTEVKPGKSGIPNGNATVNVTATTYQKKVEGAIVGYKTIVDVTCRCEQFNLNDVGLNVLLSKVGSKWFMPRMAISKGNMASTAFNTMMDKLNQQKDNVGISIEEVVIFKDNRGVSGNPGTLNLSGVTNGQVVYDAAEFRVFAVMLELDKDNEGKAIPCTGVHYKISIFHPQSIL